MGLRAKKITFVTGNSRKLAEAELGCALFEVEVEQFELDIDEIQSRDPMEVALKKARDAFEQLGKPLVITDTSWSIPALNGFPGSYMKDVAAWFNEQDFINLLKDKSDKSAEFSENIIYIDVDSHKVFSRTYIGRIVEPRGSGISIENVFEIDGVTIGERRAQGGFSHAPEDYVWAEFAEWYAEKVDSLNPH